MAVYHHTSADAADAILSTTPARFLSRERGDVYVSSRPSGHAAGYGPAIIALAIPARVLAPLLDDEFPSGERHYRLPAATAAAYAHTARRYA